MMSHLLSSPLSQRLADAVTLAEEANKLADTIAHDNKAVSDTGARLA